VKRALALTLVCALAACGLDSNDAAKDTEIPDAVKAPKVAVPAVESEFGTPVKDRVATLGVLNKRNNLTQDLVMKSGESRRIGNLVVRVATCERSLPWESPPETGAFVQVFVEERPQPSEPLGWRKVFSGWLFRNSPSLNVVEHPVYDVWVKDCAMKFPGEEEDPAEAASSRSAAKPVGKATATPEASPSPTPSVTVPALPNPSPPPVVTPSPVTTE
jgi:hypothetical protein